MTHIFFNYNADVMAIFISTIEKNALFLDSNNSLFFIKSAKLKLQGQEYFEINVKQLITYWYDK